MDPRFRRPNPYILPNPYLHRGYQPRGGSSSWSLWQAEPPAKTQWCSLVTLLVLFVVVLGVVAVAGLAFYMAALRLEPVHTQIIFDCSIRLLGDRYQTSLSNKTTTAFSDRSRRYQTLFEAVFGRSILGPSLEEIIVTSFANGSLIVFFRIILDRRKIPKGSSSLEDTTRSILLKEGASPTSVLHTLRLDLDQIYIKRYVEEAPKYYSKKEELNYEPKKGDKLRRRGDEDIVTTIKTSVEKPAKTSTEKQREEESLTTIASVKKHDNKSGVLPGMEHSPALKQFLQQRNRTKPTTTTTTSTTTTSTTTTTTTTTTSTTPKPTTTARVTTTEVSSQRRIDMPHSELPFFNIEQEPWRPIFPNNERPRDDTEIDFELGIGEAEPVQETDLKPRTVPPSIVRKDPNKNFSIVLFSNDHTPSMKPFGEDEKKGFPNLSILEQFHNLDALLRSYPRDNPPLVTLMPPRSNLGGAIRPRPWAPSPTRDPRVPQDSVVSSENLSFTKNDSSGEKPSIKLGVTAPVLQTEDSKYSLAEKIKGFALVSTDDEDISKFRSTYRGFDPDDSFARRKPKRKRSVGHTKNNKKFRRRRSMPNPLDREMKLLLEEIFHNLTTTVRSVRAGVKTTEIEFNLGPQPFTANKFDINSTRLVLNKLAKLQISNDQPHRNSSESHELNNKAIASEAQEQSDGFKLLTKILNKAPTKKQPVTPPPSNSLNATECTGDVCRNGECAPARSRCNRLQECSDGSDEAGCSCADYLRAASRAANICDSVVDCWDYSDEHNCEWCWPGQYVCLNSRQCVDQSRVCNGFPDCPYGDDEKHCITIAPPASSPTSNAYHSSGYLMVRKEGEWGKVCMQNFENVIRKSRMDWSLTGLGESVCKSMTFRSLKSVSKKPDEEGILQVSSYFELAFENPNNNSSTKWSTPREDRLSFEKTACTENEVVHVNCGDLECGIRPEATIPWPNERRRSRIVGGGNAGPGSWPWQAALYKEGEFQCGATLISDSWLLSAAHCFYHSLDEYWVARLGVLRRSLAFRGPHQQLRPISNIILHPAYQDTGFINDVALLKMERAVVLTSYVRPICLPTAVPEHGTVCTVVGWGQLFETGRIFPETLQEVELPIISTAECRKRTLFLPLYRVTDDMLCAGYERGGRDACLGDSGGPLMCQETDGRWVLTGITSNGYGCARANRPGVYTKVANYIEWIEREMRTPNLGRGAPVCDGHRCPLGQCLPKSRLCNGYTECSDSSDEAGCS